MCWIRAYFDVVKINFQLAKMLIFVYKNKWLLQKSSNPVCSTFIQSNFSAIFKMSAFRSRKSFAFSKFDLHHSTLCGMVNIYAKFHGFMPRHSRNIFSLNVHACSTKFGSPWNNDPSESHLTHSSSRHVIQVICRSSDPSDPNPRVHSGFTWTTLTLTHFAPLLNNLKWF